MVFNFHAWPVTGPVEFVLEGDAAGLALHDGAGNSVSIQFTTRTKTGEQQVAFVAQSVPACGYKTFYLAREQTTAAATPSFGGGTGPVENDRYRARHAARRRDRGLRQDSPGLARLGLRPADWARWCTAMPRSQMTGR